MKFLFVTTLIATGLLNVDAWAVSYVGIGTTSPDALLTVYTAGGFAADLVHIESGNQFVALGASSTGNFSTIRSYNSTLGSEPLLLNDIGGNVGIGTTSPGAKLDVNGGIHPGPATTGASCSGNAEGTMAYDTTAHAPVYCGSGGNWISSSGGASGYAQVTNVVNGPAMGAYYYATCTGSTKVIGGGCACGSGACQLADSAPTSTTAWGCAYTGSGAVVVIYAICANMN